MTTEPKLECASLYHPHIQVHVFDGAKLISSGYTKESVHAVLQHIREEIYLAYCLKADDANYEQYKKIKVYIESLMK